MKKEYEILKNQVFQLPIIYDSGSCEEVIAKRLPEYHDFLVNKHIDGVILHENVNSFKMKISQIFEEYYIGHQNRAYELFKEAFEYYETDMNLPVKTVLPKESLYRARKNTGDMDYKNEEMFHIKYNYRSKVKTQRYSFPGLPCLYLGASAYVCWLELNRPPMEQFQVAEICHEKGINIWVDVWGSDCAHDWDWWYKQVEYHVPHLID